MSDSDLQLIPNYATLRSQLNGISASIDQYTSDAPITSTRQLLEESLETKDMDGILYACKKIASWSERILTVSGATNTSSIPIHTKTI